MKWKKKEEFCRKLVMLPCGLIAIANIRTNNFSQTVTNFNFSQFGFFVFLYAMNEFLLFLHIFFFSFYLNHIIRNPFLLNEWKRIQKRAFDTYYFFFTECLLHEEKIWLIINFVYFLLYFLILCHIKNKSGHKFLIKENCITKEGTSK